MQLETTYPPSRKPITTQFVAVGVLAALSLWMQPGSASAQALSGPSVSRAISASVLVSMEHGEGRSEGSGTIIHADGYVLTNFHVVGHVHPFDGGVPGTLFREDGIVTLWHSTHARQESQARWTGTVVRGDPALDLAIIRIEATTEGQPVGGTTFPSLPIERNPGDLSSAVFAVGYPAGMRSVSINGGQITGFDLDADGQPSFIRVDAEFNPGNSGGALVNAAGALVGVPTLVSRRRSDISPIEKARPVSLIPASWLSELATGISNVALEVTPLLNPNGNTIRSTGSGLVANNEELFFFRVPTGFHGTIQFAVDRTDGATASGDAAVLSLDNPRSPIRTATNSRLAINPSDQGRLLVVVTVRRRQDNGAQSSVARINLRTSPNDRAIAAGVGEPALGQALANATVARYEARPDPASYERAAPRPRNSFYLGGGFLPSSLDGDNAFDGGVARLAYTGSWFATSPTSPVRFSLESGARLLIGSYRDDFFFSGTFLVGGRLSIGSEDLSVEVPFSFGIGLDAGEETITLSPYGYEIGAFLQTGPVGYGFTWLEAHRGQFSVFRSFNLSLRFQF